MPPYGAVPVLLCVSEQGAHAMHVVAFIAGCIAASSHHVCAAPPQTGRASTGHPPVTLLLWVWCGAPHSRAPGGCQVVRIVGARLAIPRAPLHCTFARHPAGVDLIAALYKSLCRMVVHVSFTAASSSCMFVCRFWTLRNREGAASSGRVFVWWYHLCVFRLTVLVSQLNRGSYQPVPPAPSINATP